MLEFIVLKYEKFIHLNPGLFSIMQNINQIMIKLCLVAEYVLYVCVNSLTTKKQTTKFSSANFQKMLCSNYTVKISVDFTVK